MMTRRARDGYKKMADENLLNLSEDLINKEVIDIAHNIYGILNLISSKYSSESVVDIIPVIINILNRLDATLKVNSDLLNTIQEVYEENNILKKTLNSEKHGRKTDLDESLLNEEKCEQEICMLNSKIKQLDSEIHALTEKLKSKNAIIDILNSDISVLTNQLQNNNSNEHWLFSKKKKNSNGKYAYASTIPNFETPNCFKELSTDDSPNIPGSKFEVEAQVHTRYSTANRYNAVDVRSNGVNCNNNKMTVLADSQGRGLNKEIKKHVQGFNSLVVYKPGAKLKHVVNGCKKWTRGFSSRDYLAVFGGANDFGFHEPHQLTIRQGLDELFSLNTETNVIIIDIPYRYDFPIFNDNIYFMNQTIQNMIHKYNGKTSFFHLQINNYLKRKHYTRHGLHLSKAGKSFVARMLGDVILQNCRGKCTTPIAVQPDVESVNFESSRVEMRPATRAALTHGTQLRHICTSPDIISLPCDLSGSPAKTPYSVTSRRLPETLHNGRHAPSTNLQYLPSTPVDLHKDSYPATLLDTPDGIQSPTSTYSTVDSDAETSLLLSDLQAFPPLPIREHHTETNNNSTENNLDCNLNDNNTNFLVHVQSVQSLI